MSSAACHEQQFQASNQHRRIQQKHLRHLQCLIESVKAHPSLCQNHELHRSKHVQKVLICDDLLVHDRDTDITRIDSVLHMNLDKLEITLKQALKDAATGGADARFLFGSDCHPNMCHIINGHGGKIIGLKTVSKLSAMKALIVELGNNRTKLIEMLR